MAWKSVSPGNSVSISLVPGLQTSSCIPLFYVGSGDWTQVLTLAQWPFSPPRLLHGLLFILKNLSRFSGPGINCVSGWDTRFLSYCLAAEATKKMYTALTSQRHLAGGGAGEVCFAHAPRPHMGISSNIPCMSFPVMNPWDLRPLETKFKTFWLHVSITNHYVAEKYGILPVSIRFCPVKHLQSEFLRFQSQWNTIKTEKSKQTKTHRRRHNITLSLRAHLLSKSILFAFGFCLFMLF